MVGVAVLVRHHAHHLGALHLGAERAAHAAVGAGGDDAVLGLAVVDDRLFHQRGGGAGLHAGPARHALGDEEALLPPGGDHRGEAAAVDGERERALHLLARAHAARAHDALGRIEGEVGVGLVLLRRQVVGAVVAVAHFAQAHRRRPSPAARSCRWRDRSDSRAGDRRCTAPSRRGAAWRARRSACAPSCPARPAWCTRRGSPCGPRSPPGTGGRSRTTPACRWRTAWACARRLRRPRA